MPHLLPFPRFHHPAPGITERLPVTRNGIRNLQPYPFRTTEGPTFAALTIRNGETGRIARGLCGLLPATAFLDGTVLPHERTLTTRLDRQERLIRTDRGALGKPVLLTTPEVPRHLPLEERDDEQVIFYGDNHIYRLQTTPHDPNHPIELPAGPLVIADGHHRAYTHARLAAAGVADCAYVPVVVVGAEDLVIGNFLRLIDGQGVPAETLLQRLRAYFTVAESARPLPPTAPGHWLLSYLDRHYALTRRPELDPADTDSGWLNTHVLPTTFGITDTRTDPRILSVDPPPRLNGEAHFDPLESDRIKLLGYPLGRDRFFREVSAGRTLPPKSTRFEPRVPSGLLVWVP